MTAPDDHADLTALIGLADGWRKGGTGRTDGQTGDLTASEGSSGPECHPSPAIAQTGCGGCKGLGSHQRYCPRHPNYHPWRRLADMAESIGDQIGSNNTGIANTAYALSGRIKALIPTTQPSDDGADGGRG